MARVNLMLDWSGTRALIRVNGYLSRQVGEDLLVLLLDLGRMQVERIDLEIDECSPVCVGALEILLDAKFRLAARGVHVRFGRPPRTVSKVFCLMGLRSDGELPADRGVTDVGRRSEGCDV